MGSYVLSLVVGGLVCPTLRCGSGHVVADDALGAALGTRASQI